MHDHPCIEQPCTGHQNQCSIEQQACCTLGIVAVGQVAQSLWQILLRSSTVFELRVASVSPVQIYHYTGATSLVSSVPIGLQHFGEGEMVSRLSWESEMMDVAQIDPEQSTPARRWCMRSMWFCVDMTCAARLCIHPARLSSATESNRRGAPSSVRGRCSGTRSTNI
jgi:hypothetical protein